MLSVKSKVTEKQVLAKCWKFNQNHSKQTFIQYMDTYIIRNNLDQIQNNKKKCILTKINPFL